MKRKHQFFITLTLFLLFYEINNPYKRHILTKRFYDKDKLLAKRKNKKVMVIL